MVTDTTVIPRECCISQHKLLFCVVRWRDKIKRVKKKFVSKCQVWQLQEKDKDIVFREGVGKRSPENW